MNDGDLVTLAVIVAYFLFYTAYDKSSKTIKSKLLLEVLLIQNGIDHTLVQINKVVALSALTLVGLIFIPQFRHMLGDSEMNVILLNAFYLVITHTSYSVFKYYGSNNIPKMSTWTRVVHDNYSRIPTTKLQGRRNLSLIAGATASFLLELWYFNLSSLQGVTAAVMLFASIIHFYFMEIDFRGILQVRPFAYLAFLIPGISIVLLSFA